MPACEIVAEGLAFPEGPVVMADGSVIVVETFGGRITRCWNGRTETLCQIGDGPNGAAIGPDAALYVCNNGGIGPDHCARPDSIGRIERVDLRTGRYERLYDACDGRSLSAPNDLMFDCDGNLWFTDFGRIERDGKRFGGLYCARPDGTAITRIFDHALSFNGVGVSPDMHTVYVADTYQSRIYAFDRSRTQQRPRLLSTIPGLVSLDSLAMTAAGNVCVATIGSRGAISTVTPDGTVSAVATEDPITTNIAFGGADMRDGYITLSGKGVLARMRWHEPGMRLVYNS
jgi:gluconolactonase